MERRGNGLAVTPKGKQLLSLVNPWRLSKLTAKWEQSLEAIAQGKEDPKKFLKISKALPVNWWQRSKIRRKPTRTSP